MSLAAEDEPRTKCIRRVLERSKGGSVAARLVAEDNAVIDGAVIEPRLYESSTCGIQAQADGSGGARNELVKRGSAIRDPQRFRYLPGHAGLSKRPICLVLYPKPV